MNTVSHLKHLLYKHRITLVFSTHDSLHTTTYVCSRIIHCCLFSCAKFHAQHFAPQVLRFKGTQRHSAVCLVVCLACDDHYGGTLCFISCFMFQKCTLLNPISSVVFESTSPICRNELTRWKPLSSAMGRTLPTPRPFVRSTYTWMTSSTVIVGTSCPPDCAHIRSHHQHWTNTKATVHSNLQNA